MAADERTLLDLNKGTRATALEQQMMIAGCNECASTNDGVVGFSSFHGNVAEAVEPVGKARVKSSGMC